MTFVINFMWIKDPILYEYNLISIKIFHYKFEIIEI